MAEYNINEENLNKEEAKVACKPTKCDGEIKFEVCEEFKDSVLVTEPDSAVRVIRLKVVIKHLCPHRNLNMAIQLVDCETKRVISQKGRCVYTGCENNCNNSVEEYFYFTFVGNLCNPTKGVYFNVITNYINLIDNNHNCDCQLED